MEDNNLKSYFTQTCAQMSTQSTITAKLAVTREKRSHLSFPLLENIMWHADFLERKCDICTVAIVEIFKLDVSLIIIESNIDNVVT